MKTNINIKVEDDFVGTITVNENPRQYWANIIYACKNNATLSLKNINGNNATFLFLIQGSVVAEQTINIYAQPDIFAAYQSNPSFEVIEVNN